MFAWLFGSATHAPVLLGLRSSKTYIIITVATAIFTDIFVYGIVVPVLPFALTARVDVSPTHIQTWISIFLAVYGAGLLVASPICGWVADRTTSRRWPLIFGLVALAGATAMLCVGSSIAVLAAGRVLQGISAAVVWVVGLALLVDTVGADGIGQAMGYVGLSMSLAILVAPLLGGIVFAASGYYAVFAMAFGLIALDVFLRLSMVEKKVAARWLPQEEVVADGGLAVGEGKIIDGLPATGDVDVEMNPVQSPSSAVHDSPEQPISSAVSPAEAAQPTQPQTRYERFKINLPPVIFLLSSRRVLSSTWACLIQASLLTAFDTILPLYVRDTFHWNSTGAGLIFLPLVVTSFFGPVIGRLSDRHGPRWYATAGFVSACPTLILMRLVHDDTLGQKALLCGLLALLGVTLTVVLTPMMAEIAYAVDAKARRHPPGFFGRNGAYAQAYSLFNMAWAGGTMVGPLLAGLVNQTQGWGTATLILGIVSAVTAVPTAIWTGGSIFKEIRAEKLELQQEGEREIQPATDA